MGVGADAAAGWRLVVPVAQQIMPRRILTLTLLGAVAAGLVAAVIAWLTSGADAGPPAAAARTLTLAGGLAAGGVLVYVVVFVRTVRRNRRLVAAGRSAIAGAASEVAPRRRRPVVSADVSATTLAEIRTAAREGREPLATVEQRLSAARTARIQRQSLPGTVLQAITFAQFAPAAALFYVGFQSVFVGLYVVAMCLLTAGQAFASLVSLGRTAAYIDTSPAEPPPEAPPGPHKLLGTDHPDDYRR